MNAVPKVELLAPAGNMEGFYGAIHAGADAVYLAGKEYGARAYADNFSEEELLACFRYAHIWQRKVYLTVNTLMKESEAEKLCDFLRPLADGGLDGVIVQDFGAFQLIKENFPGLPLHVSTQMAVTGAYGAKLLKQMGAVRIVPARELSLKEIREMKQETGLELECFVHGAMCYCYSGRCLFSSIVGGRSGNRGRCAQPCRLPYQVSEVNGKTMSTEQYPLSLKDMCTLEILPELIEAGIDSFKIEGRMKKPEYTAGVTALYRKYIDLYYAGMKAAPSKADMDHLRKLYIRSEIQEGYYHKKNGADMITLSNPAYSGSDDRLLEQIRKDYILKKPHIPVVMKAFFHIGRPAEIQIFPAASPEKSACVYGAVVEPAAKVPVTRENLVKQLTKLGETCFELVALDGAASGEPYIEMDEGIFYPLKAVNELRRNAAAALEEVLIHEA